LGEIWCLTPFLTIFQLYYGNLVLSSNKGVLIAGIYIHTTVYCFGLSVNVYFIVLSVNVYFIVLSLNVYLLVSFCECVIGQSLCQCVLYRFMGVLTWIGGY
jgi:hypothetical protein